MLMNSTRTYEYKDKEEFLNWTYQDSELVIGLVGAVGTEQQRIVQIIKDRLKAYRYETEEIRVSHDVIGKIYEISDTTNEFERISTTMDLGNLARKESGDNGILAFGVAQ